MKKTMTKYISVILIFSLIFVSGCGKKEEEQYSSPNFQNAQKDFEYDEQATPLDASISDAIMMASFGDASITDAQLSTQSDALASATNASIMGYYEDNTYYNALADFKIKVDDDEWKFYDAAGVASATNADLDYINNLWAGYKSPYDEGTTYAAIAYNTRNGSNIIVSYVNPSTYLMPDFNAQAYMKMASRRYIHYAISNVTFLGQKYSCLDVKDEMSVIGRRTQFAIDKEGLIVLITFTMQDEAPLEDAVRMLSPINYEEE